MEDEIDTYNETLNGKRKSELIEWSNNIILELEKKVDLINDKIIILAEKNYYKYLIPHFKNYKLPLEGLPLGKRMSFLNRMIMDKRT